MQWLSGLVAMRDCPYVSFFKPPNSVRLTLCGKAREAFPGLTLRRYSLRRFGSDRQMTCHSASTRDHPGLRRGGESECGPIHPMRPRSQAAEQPPESQHPAWEGQARGGPPDQLRP
jgi:hypothetical protein